MRYEEGEDVSQNTFYKDGIAYQKKQRRRERAWRREQQERAAELEAEEEEEIELHEGRMKREELKEALFEYL